jgi:hypothetical protein
VGCGNKYFSDLNPRQLNGVSITRLKALPAESGERFYAELTIPLNCQNYRTLSLSR